MIKLNKYPVIIIEIPTIPKNIAINFNFIARLSITISGKLRAEVDIINARAVPSGIPFSNKTSATGKIAAQFA